MSSHSQQGQQVFTTACFGALTAGLSTANQHTSVLYLLPCVLAVLVRGYRHLMTPARLAVLTILVLIGPLTYIHLPLATLRHTARVSWGDQSTWEGFRTHVLREEYGTFDLALRTSTNTTFVERIGLHAQHASQESMHLILPLAIIGSIVPSSQRLYITKALLISMLVLYEVFFHLRANLPVEQPLILGVVERFWMQSNLILAILAGCGFASLAAYCAKAAKINRDVLTSSIAVVLTAVLINANWSARDESANTAVSDYGRAILQGLKPNSILLTSGDLIGNSARYHHYCEGLRPDVAILDSELMTFDWYTSIKGRHLPKVVFPGEKPVFRAGPKHYNMKQFLDANFKRYPHVYVFKQMHREDPSWMQGYHVWHAGLTYRVVPHGHPLDLQLWLDEALRALPNFTSPDESKYDDRTWEAVVRKEYELAGVELAVFFEDLTRSQTDKVIVKQCWQASVQTYLTMIKQAQALGNAYPPFWHKNLGVAAQRLEELDHEQATQWQAMRTRHWLKYYESGVEDEQMDAIAEALAVDGVLLW
eukprot:TRINITY_DN10335_c0_g1_i2.p1 TRINITY_DN10335_c0_g1~~TRINITY_DN10335_c0_g1_i2.p1  ORF type:complete len:612 (+),score=82.42 TRINITY_DN10335_c0_g1_i2:229-1836(+)